MNRYHLIHVTEFAYDDPVSESYNELRLRPMHANGKVAFRFALSPRRTPAAQVIAMPMAIPCISSTSFRNTGGQE